MTFKKISEVFSSEKIDLIKDNVRELMQPRYGSIINRAEIAIGDFYNGLALVYIGKSQNLMDERFELESNSTAQLAINLSGEFVKIKLENDQEFYGFETYNKETDSTLVSFSLYRAKEVVSNGTVSTDDFANWRDSKDNVKLSNDFFCKCLVKKGDCKPRINDISCFIGYQAADDNYDDEEYDDFDDFIYEEEEREEQEYEEQNVICSSYYIQCWGVTRKILNSTKLNTTDNTRYVIHRRYILLCDNMRNYMPEDYFEYDDPDKYCHSYYNLFARYRISETDILSDRYGVFDLYKKRIIIHVGEMGYTQAMISGFVRIDFLKNQEILTFDYFDIKANKGVSYNSKLTYKGVRNLATSCIDGRQYNLAANIITDYWGIEETRTGKNTGEWYIIREGKNAGRTLCWLLANGKIKDVVYMIASSYLSFNNFHHFTYPSSHDTKKRNKIWLALDRHNIFKEIMNPEDVLELVEPFSRYSMTKHQTLTSDSWGQQEPNFEELVDVDTDYLVGLIHSHCLSVGDSVIEELEDAYNGNKSYLSKLSKVIEANERYNEEFEAYEERCESEMRSRWEEERFWENEGYCSAFEDDPDAEWNID